MISADKDYDQTIFEMLNITEPRKEAYFSITSKQNNVLYDTETKPDLDNIKGGNLIIPQSLEELKKRPEKLLYFGSLFGSHRVMLRLTPSREFFKELKQSLVPINPSMLSVVSSIVEKLGGAGKYISVHARGGDSDFRRGREINFANLIENINKEFPEVSRYSSSLEECPLNFTEPRDEKNRILYVASDLDRNHESMKVFLCLLGGIKAKHKYPILDKPTNDLTQQQPQKNQCTTTALKHIDLKGGLDRYLLTMKDDKLEKAAELDVRLLDSGNN
ncbi:13482_t:CDS:2 [Entrophospora sp. SA101]|nr:13482_t:CDS:2 [Entrophospora sp. SA101]